MNWKGFRRKWPWANRGTIPGGTEGNHKKPSQDSRYPGRDLNRAPPEYQSRAVPLDQCFPRNVYEMVGILCVFADFLQ
jgi:hypothetical protein